MSLDMGTLSDEEARGDHFFDASEEGLFGGNELIVLCGVVCSVVDLLDGVFVEFDGGKLLAVVENVLDGHCRGRCVVHVALDDTRNVGHDVEDGLGVDDVLDGGVFRLWGSNGCEEFREFVGLEGVVHVFLKLVEELLDDIGVVEAGGVELGGVEFHAIEEVRDEDVVVSHGHLVGGEGIVREEIGEGLLEVLKSRGG